MKKDAHLQFLEHARSKLIPKFVLHSMVDLKQFKFTVSRFLQRYEV